MTDPATDDIAALTRRWLIEATSGTLCTLSRAQAAAQRSAGLRELVSS